MTVPLCAVLSEPEAVLPELEGGPVRGLTEQQRAEALARYAATLLAAVIATLDRLQAETPDQAATVGHLRAERDVLAVRVALLTPPP